MKLIIETFWLTAIVLCLGLGFTAFAIYGEPSSSLSKVTPFIYFIALAYVAGTNGSSYEIRKETQRLRQQLRGH